MSAAVMLPCCAGACCEACAQSGITCFGNCPLCQDAVEMEDLIPYRMLRDKIDKYNDKLKEVVDSNNEKTIEFSVISAENITFDSSPSHPNKFKDHAEEEENNGEVHKDEVSSPKSLSLSSVSSSPSLSLSPVSEVNSGYSIPTFQSPRFNRPRHCSSSTAKFSSPWRGSSPHLSPVPRTDLKSLIHPPPVPGAHHSRLQPHNDTLAQFQEAMKNMEAQKRARKLWHQQQQINNKIVNIVKHIPEEPSPGRKSSKSQGKGTEDDADPVNESRSSTPSPMRNAMKNCSAVSEGSFKEDEDGIRNSKHILCSGQIVQNPSALAEMKKTTSSENKEGSTLKKALDNMKFVEEERMRKLRENTIDHDHSSESEGMKSKKKKEKKKKRKKDKLEKAERKLRKLLKKKGLDKEVLAKILKKAKKKKSKKEAEVIELEDVSSPESVTIKEPPPKPKISPIIERRVQHSEGNVQINVYQVESGRREERNRERSRDKSDREHRRDRGGHYHHPRRDGSRDRSPPVYHSSFSNNNNRSRHLDSYSSGRFSRMRR